ncbi:hypothetical protein M9H77_12734 [Catharanthus roseus]|uniref:Uncharacterized protein n=1 Tax=Catharanthus roseus TaxID=4058 RepID=A0ACC0BI87_CATRO|nr:hypothetical protein M9H77_12734 [Catharanthus roseus]
MYEVTQNADFSSKVDALSKKFDQLLALNTLPTNSPNVQKNPRANYHEQAKAVITIRNGKLVDNKVGEPIKDNYTFIEKENLICTENVNSNLACIAPPENSSLIVNHELNMREIDPVCKPSRDHTRPLRD